MNPEEFFFPHQEATPDLKLTAADLVEDSEYEFRVAAENKNGLGPFSSPCKPVTIKSPYVKPGKPGRPSASNVKGFTLDLQWKAPDSDGGTVASLFLTGLFSIFSRSHILL